VSYEKNEKIFFHFFEDKNVDYLLLVARLPPEDLEDELVPEELPDRDELLDE
tara:strand:+ start:559 stop:714 length:156 start_codon:yes stop_codon:yes gene_type:complete